jgi:hypothetical protein
MMGLSGRTMLFVIPEDFTNHLLYRRIIALLNLGLSNFYRRRLSKGRRVSAEKFSSPDRCV